MQPYVLAKSRLTELIQLLQKDRRVVGPVARETKFAFAPIDDPAELRMDYPISLLSPKKYFFPQYETLLKFKRGSAAATEAPVEAEPTALVGVHPCDITSTWLLDKVFSDNHKDPYYLNRRDRALIIGLDCGRPCDDRQFCNDMGSLYPSKGFDLFMQDLGDRYFVRVGSERGQALIEQSALFAPASREDLLAHEQFEQVKGEQFQPRLPFPAERIDELLADSYDSLIWSAVSRRCFSCGSCNLVCPTCYCFTVDDELEMDLQTGRRVRRWDACQLRDFAEVAGGENFREQAAERLRHRVMRKGKYMVEQFGELGCVGCGRCDRNCVGGISIRKTFEQLWEYKMQIEAEKKRTRPEPALAELTSQYLPRVGRLVDIEKFTDREKWFKVRLEDKARFDFLAGQFVEVSLFGVGEAPISICSAPDASGHIELCVRAVGDVTRQMHQLEPGQAVGIRGPFGNGFDVRQIEGQDVLFVAGGLGLAPCRSFIQDVLARRDRFGEVTILYGARTPGELLFRKDLQAWAQRGDCNLKITVDRPDEGWVGHVGVITTLFRDLAIDPNRTAVFIIGPPVMFKYAVMEVLAMGVPESKILCSLERRMKCGLGKCGHCQIRDIYVCQDGPVFTYQQVKRMREGI